MDQMILENKHQVNRINQAFEAGEKPLLNVYFTAGYPELADTQRIVNALDKSGADIVEIGLPFSDPVADGPTIQQSSHHSLQQGMSLKLLFEQLADLRQNSQIPVVLMGYLNPVLQYGFEEFCASCREVGVDGLILPDLPMHEYLTTYKSIMQAHGLVNIFLITPQTSVDRIRDIDENSDGFIYVVSSYSTTGAKSIIDDKQIQYFKRISEMGLKRNLLIGFGISNHETFIKASEYADGAIIGSAFIKQLEKDASDQAISTFVKNIKEGQS